MAAITAGIVALATAAANDAVPSVKELTEAARGMREAMDEAKATYDDTVTSTMAAAGVADTYIGKLEEMEAAGLNTDEQHRQYHNTLALLCQVVPELADYIDLETDTINGGTEALRANTEAWKQNAMQQAYQDQLTELYSQYSAVLIEAEENSIGLTKAQYSLEAAQQKLSDTYAQMDELISFLNGYENLYCIGRNGQHRYNNMDHSMLTAIRAVEAVRAGRTDKSEIWNVNTEQEYHEEKHT